MLRFLAKLFDWLVVAAFIGAAVFGYRWYFGEGHCKVRNVVPGGDRFTESYCWVTLEFRSYPKEGNRRDVNLTLTSEALAQPVQLSWNNIASQAQVPHPPYGHDPAGWSASQDPQLGKPIDLRIKLPLRQKIETGTFNTLMITAELTWAGKLQGRRTATLRHLYETEMPQ
jgi:hypothetical protein